MSFWRTLESVTRPLKARKRRHERADTQTGSPGGATGRGRSLMSTIALLVCTMYVRDRMVVTRGRHAVQSGGRDASFAASAANCSSWMLPSVCLSARLTNHDSRELNGNRVWGRPNEARIWPILRSPNTYGEVWPRNDRHFVSITWHNVWS